MDESPESQTNPGMSTFANTERQQLGQNLRLAVACIEGSVKPVRTKAMPSDEADIRQRLKTLSQDITSHHADLLELLVRFDELQGWKSGGASHCAAWMNLEIGISLQLSWEYLRVGRKLRPLPVTTALFRAGKLSWSKIRLIVTVASEDNEKTLCHASLDASVSDVKLLCEGYRWKQNRKDSEEDSENERALKQIESRALLWDEFSHGNTRIQLILPPEVAQAFLKSVEHSLNQLEDIGTEQKMSQRRADAAVLMAERSLQAAGRDIATADRYQVTVSVNASDLTTINSSNNSQNTGNTNNKNNKNNKNNTNNKNNKNNKNGSASHDESLAPSRKNVPLDPVSANQYSLPGKRPALTGVGPIAMETARRITCDCTIVSKLISNGEPSSIGHTSRIWTKPQTRFIKDRDEHCQWPGCSHTQHLKIHHIIHWADGGPTSVENGVSVCQYHHSMLHEGGYTIQRIGDKERYADELFALQQRTNEPGMFDFEKDLRSDRKAFDRTRQLMPTRYRFRVVDARGRDVRELQLLRANGLDVSDSSVSDSGVSDSSVSNSGVSNSGISDSGVSDSGVSGSGISGSGVSDSSALDSSINKSLKANSDLKNRDNQSIQIADKDQGDHTKNSDTASDPQYPISSSYSTRVECNEPMPYAYLSGASRRDVFILSGQQHTRRLSENRLIDRGRDILASFPRKFRRIEQLFTSIDTKI